MIFPAINVHLVWGISCELLLKVNSSHKLSRIMVHVGIRQDDFDGTSRSAQKLSRRLGIDLRSY
jgi:hypothetical protein